MFDWFTEYRRVATRVFTVLAFASSMSANFAFAFTYSTSPALNVYTSGIGLKAKVESTNGSNPINNGQLRFTVSRISGTFTSNGVMCFGRSAGDGGFVPIYAVNYSIGQSSVTFPDYSISYVGDRSFRIQRSSNSNTSCTSLDTSNVSGIITVTGNPSPPQVTALTIAQAGSGVGGTVQVVAPDSYLQYIEIHFSNISSTGPYNCSIRSGTAEDLHSWYADITNSSNADTAAGRTCATVFTGIGAHTIWAKVEALTWEGNQAAVPTAVHPKSTTVNWVPIIDSVSPLSGVSGQTAGISVFGSSLPLSVVATITNQPACTRASATATRADFSCPLTMIGSQTLTLKTNTDVNGGTFMTSKPFAVKAVGGTEITSITPGTARLDLSTQFTVTGTGLTSGMGFAVDDCELVTEVAGGTSTSRSWTCIPRAPGIKTARIKTTPSGTELRTEQVRIEHPQRLGDASAKGNPSVGGVSLFNGNFFMQSVDLAVPGRGISFALNRSYNSYDWQYETDQGGVPKNSPWRFNFQMKIGFVPNSGNKRLYIAREDGSGESYFLSSGTWYPIDLGNFSTIKVNGDGTYTVQTRGQLSHTFDPPSGTGRLLRTNDRDGNQITYAYGTSGNGNGKVVQIADSSARTYSVTYDAQFRVSRVTDFTGRYVEYTYTDTVNGRISTFRDVRGGITTYAYNASGDLTTVTDPRLNAALTLTYVTVYGNKGVKSLTTAVGRATGGRTCNGSTDFTYCFTYTALAASAGFRTLVDGPENAAISAVTFDNAGRATAITDGQNNTRTSVFADITESANYAKSALATTRKSALAVAGGYQTDIGLNLTHGLVESVKNPESELSSTGWALNAASNLFTPTTVTSPLSNTSGMGFTSAGRPNRITAANQFATSGAAGPSTTLTWTAGQLTGIANPVGDAITLTRDPLGNLSTTTDPRNAAWVTIRAYDTLGRVITLTDARGAITRYTYDAAGNVLTSTQEIPSLPSIVNTHTYDANGNLATHVDPRGTLTTYTYDIGNRLTTISSVVSGVTTTRTLGYDNASRLVSVTNENNNTSNRTFDAAGRVTSEALPLSRTTQYAYDADNRLKTVTDPENRTVNYTYDRVGRVKSVTNTLNLTQRYQYDPDGRLIAFQDAKGNITRYGYDRNGNLTTVTDANNVTSSASYDNANRMVSRTDPRGKTTRYTYDAAGNLVTETDPINNVWTYTYDQNSNLTNVLNPDGRNVAHIYDALNRRTRTTYSNTTQVNYTYDANSNLKTMVDSIGLAGTTYVYDEANRLKQFTDPFSNVVSYTFDKAGNRITMTYPGSRVVNYGYDAAERMSTVTDWTPRTATYTYNRADQITRLVHGNGTTADYTYDTAGRLTSLVNKQSNNTVISSHVHTLDPFGNITQADEILPLQPTLTPRIKRWAVDDANRVLTDSVSGDSFEHDPAGRVIRQIISGVTTNFAYNDLDLLNGLNRSGLSESYRYNGHGHRLERTVNGTVTRFLIEPNGVMPNTLAELNSANAAQRMYVYGANGLLSQIDSSGGYRAYHYGPIGHTTALTNATGLVADTYVSMPFGESFVGASNLTSNPFRAGGQLGVIDDLNGLLHVRARQYSVTAGRFLSVDRLAGSVIEPQSLNRHGFALGNPLLYGDPSGMLSKEIQNSFKAKAPTPSELRQAGPTTSDPKPSLHDEKCTDSANSYGMDIASTSCAIFGNKNSNFTFGQLDMTLQNGAAGIKLDVGPKLKTENVEVAISIVAVDVGGGVVVTEDENFAGLSGGASASVSTGVNGTAKGGGVTVSGGVEVVGGFSAKVAAEVCKDGYGARVEGEVAFVAGASVKLGGCVNPTEVKATAKKVKTAVKKAKDWYMKAFDFSEQFSRSQANATQGANK